jgi:hypothetical protein
MEHAQASDPIYKITQCPTLKHNMSPHSTVFPETGFASSQAVKLKIQAEDTLTFKLNGLQLHLKNPYSNVYFIAIYLTTFLVL